MEGAGAEFIHILTVNGTLSTVVPAGARAVGPSAQAFRLVGTSVALSSDGSSQPLARRRAVRPLAGAVSLKSSAIDQ
jgi:hypothetical protein